MIIWLLEATIEHAQSVALYARNMKYQQYGLGHHQLLEISEGINICTTAAAVK